MIDPLFLNRLHNDRIVSGECASERRMVPATDPDGASQAALSLVLSVRGARTQRRGARTQRRGARTRLRHPPPPASSQAAAVIVAPFDNEHEHRRCATEHENDGTELGWHAPKARTGVFR